MAGELELRVTIRLGNDAMQSGDDLADALDYIAERLRDDWGSVPIESATHAESVRDENGNRVGQFKIRDD